ncbi:MAG: phosphotransferase, partial [Gemmatimonadales bacterium]
PLSSGEAVAIAEPLAFLPEHRMLLQRGIAHERTLKALLPAAFGEPGRAEVTAAETGLRQTGAGLAALHGCGTAHGGAFSLDSRIEQVRGLADRFVRLWPQVRAAAEPVIRLVAARAAACPAGALVPSHGSFRPGQVLLTGQGIAFIDFDDFCRAERELDVARFSVTVKTVGLRALSSDESERVRTDRLSEVDQRCRIFTDAYADGGELDRGRLALWEALDLLTNVLNAWAKAKLDRLDATLALLSAHLERSGMTGSR